VVIYVTTVESVTFRIDDREDCQSVTQLTKKLHFFADVD
jgi:hypothetical protein